MKVEAVNNHKLTDLGPLFTEEQADLHFNKHHKGYEKKLVALFDKDEHKGLKDKSLEEIISESKGGVYNLAAQIYNHNVFWSSISTTKKEIPEKLKTALVKSFGSLEKFEEEFMSKGTSLFGSGWVWLVENDKKELQLTQGSNAHNPISDNLKPLMTCDVWEHAYYVDYKNDRGSFLKKFWNHIDWDFAASNLS